MNEYVYTYDVENIRTKKCVGETITEYTHNANSKLSQLLMKTENGVTTYYVYGRGLIGEEVNGAFKTYHYDYRGSTVAITDETGAVTDRFGYDTYGRLISRTGTTNTQFLYNGRDGVMTDENGLVYMRARYYSPELKRFINADVIAGSITNAITLNRYAYANGNPVSNIDPFGLSAERGSQGTTIDVVIPNSYSAIMDDASTDFIVASAWRHLEKVENQYGEDLWAGLKWYNSADEAAYAFGLQYVDETNEIYKGRIHEKTIVEHSAQITSVVVYLYKDQWLTLGQVQALHNVGEITSMRDFFRNTTKSKAYTYSSIEHGKKPEKNEYGQLIYSVPLTFENRYGKVVASVHTHPAEADNNLNFSDLDINTTKEHLAYGVRRTDINSLNTARAMPEYGLYMFTYIAKRDNREYYLSKYSDTGISPIDISGFLN